MTRAEQRRLLERGEVAIQGRMPWSSNHTYLTDLCHEDQSGHAIYKPRDGERPLWDFPDGLFRREVAAYELSAALGWDLVPVTIERADAPLGLGSLQWFVDADFEQHYFTLVENERWWPQLQRICAFDLLANNTDRKSGHCLIDGDGHIWAIDNGLSFHAEFKLRTVIWEFGGEPVPDAILDDVQALRRRRTTRHARAAARHVRARRRAGAGPCPLARAGVPHRSERPALSLAADMSEAELDDLVRQIDRLCDQEAWDELVALRDRCRAALERGKQLWPAASLAEYRLALDAPGSFAGQVLVPDAGHMALGPLAEVAAVNHTWRQLRDAIPAGPQVTIAAHERVLRGEDLRDEPLIDTRVLDLPPVLQSWEPSYPLAEYEADEARFPPPSLPPRRRGAAGRGAPIDDVGAVNALIELCRTWTSESNGRAEAVAVEGDATAAVAALGPSRVRMAELDQATALAWMAWVGASGGAHGPTTWNGRRALRCVVDARRACGSRRRLAPASR